MNDQQLVAALRALDRPVVPEPAFADALYDTLRRQAFPVARQPLSRNVLLVAALLAAAALGLALAVGSRLFDERPLLVDASATPGVRTYAVEIPDGVSPASAPEQIAAVIASVDGDLPGLSASVSSITRMTWLPGGTEVPTVDGTAMSSDVAFWIVEVALDDGNPYLLLVTDADPTLGGGNAPPGPPPTNRPIIPIATRDPALPVRLTSDGGVAVTATVLPVPGADVLPQLGPLVAVDGSVWFLATSVYTDGEISLVRIDTRSNEIRAVPAPIDPGSYGSLVAGRSRLWLSTIGGAIALDPSTGASQGRLEIPEDGTVVGEDDAGLWVRVIGGIVLLDPATGSELRRVDSSERDQPYRGIWQPPAFGSLWDVDRSSGTVIRLDPTTGEVIATIDLGADGAGCGMQDGQPQIGLAGIPDAIGIRCASGMVLVDPARNEVLGVYPGSDIVAGGAWWSMTSAPDIGSPSWRTPNALLRTGPSGSSPTRTLTLSLEAHAISWITVADDSLWALIAERAGPDEAYEHNAAVLRLPMADLTQ